VSSISASSHGGTATLEPTNAPSITLVTCYPFYFVGSAPERFIVRAELAGDATEVASGQN
jgi:sortase A